MIGEVLKNKLLNNNNNDDKNNNRIFFFIFGLCMDGVRCFL